MTQTSIRPTSRDDETYSETVRRLAGSQKKAARGAPAYSVFVNRKLGRLLAAAAWHIGLTPNAVTGISAVFTFAAIIVIATVPPSAAAAIAVTAGLVIGYALDSADGQLARLRGGGSVAGEWLDHVVDCIKTSSLHLAVLISAYRFFDLQAGWLLVPLAFAVVAAGSFFAQILNDQLKAVHAGPNAVSAVAGGGTLLRSLLVLPTDYGVMCLVFVLLFEPMLFFPAYTLLFIANAGHFALALRKWYGDMRKLA